MTDAHHAFDPPDNAEPALRSTEDHRDEALGAAAGMADTPPGASTGPAVVADGEFHQLDPRSVRVDRIVGWITAAIVAGVSLLVILIVLLTTRLPVWGPVPMVVAWMLLVGLFVWLAQRWPEISYRHTSYRVDGFGIEIRHGVVWRTIVSVPRSRVQHTDVSQGPLERSQGLGTLVVYTAGTSHARVGLAGLAYERALALRDYLVAGEGADAV